MSIGISSSYDENMSQQDFSEILELKDRIEKLKSLLEECIERFEKDGQTYFADSIKNRMS